MDEPPPGLTPKQCAQKKEVQPAWNDDCSALQELKYDGEMPDASPYELFLDTFEYSSGAGLPFCAPTWYKFVYVDPKTGNYGNPSQWTQSAIFAGGPAVNQCWPCTSNNNNILSCTNCSIPEGKDSCTFNKPTLTIPCGEGQLPAPPGKPDNEGNLYFANVHRWRGSIGDPNPPPDGAPGTIIGFLFPPDSKNNCKFIDATNNPCPTATGPNCPKRCVCKG